MLIVPFDTVFLQPLLQGAKLLKIAVIDNRIQFYLVILHSLQQVSTNKKHSTMKVLLVNGSPHPHGCTHTALQEVAEQLHQQGIETEEIWCGNKPVMGCIGCGK